MTSTPTEQTEDQNATVAMRHPDLGDVVQVPRWAVQGHEDRGYELVTERDEAAAVEVDPEPKRMVHPDLGDVVTVPWFAVAGYLERGFEVVAEDGTETPTPEQTLPALPAPTGASTTRATTSGTAKTPSPDSDTTPGAATPTD